MCHAPSYSSLTKQTLAKGDNLSNISCGLLTNDLLHVSSVEQSCSFELLGYIALNCRMACKHMIMATLLAGKNNLFAGLFLSKVFVFPV